MIRDCHRYERWDNGLYLPATDRRVLRPKQMNPAAVSGGMSAAANNIAFIQTLGNQTTGAGASVSSLQSSAMGSSLTNGSTIIVFVRVYGSGGDFTVSGITDTAGNTYVSGIVLDAIGRSNNGSVEIWYANNTHTTASNKITVSYTGSSFTDFCAAEFSGVKAVSPVDVSHSASGNDAAGNPGAFSTANAFDLICLCLHWGFTGNGAATVPAGYTRVSDQLSGGLDFGCLDTAYKIVSTTQSSITPTWSNDSALWGCVALALKSS